MYSVRVPEAVALKGSIVGVALGYRRKVGGNKGKRRRNEGAWGAPPGHRDPPSFPSSLPPALFLLPLFVAAVGGGRCCSLHGAAAGGRAFVVGAEGAGGSSGGRGGQEVGRV
ncbi:hypothetical protein E2C01_046064 [Portunus trituberculatus]|uniref:Uncharacterized protein n=1 Tax=Portunus trituberculatus TaxID=210409 RepID=A0A5B7FXF4_PORTR|nr:hypothetical protein [Portunus trituberculatus]